MNLDNYLTHIHLINESIYNLKKESKKLHDICKTFGQFDKDFSEHTLFEDFIAKTPNDSVDVQFQPGSSKEPFTLKVEQIATPAKQRGYSMNKKNKWKTEIGRIGGLSVKEDSLIIIKNNNNPQFHIEIKPIQELNIFDETSMETALELIKNTINQKANDIAFPIEAFIEEDDLNGDEMVRMNLTSTITGEDTNFKVIDENGKIAEQIGIKRETNMFNYSKGTNSHFEINKKPFISSKNEAILDNENIIVTFNQLLLEEVEISFHLNSEVIYQKIKNFFISINPFITFLKEHNEYLRSDLLKIILYEFNERKEDFFQYGVTLDDEYIFNINEEQLKDAIIRNSNGLKHLLFAKTTGFVYSLFIISEQILSKPFSIFAKETYNPSIFIHPNTTTKINRNLKHTIFLDEEF